MTERHLWQLMKRHWRDVHLVRVENAATFGTPDINCCYNGIEWWIETKTLRNGMAAIRPTQLAWMIQRLKVKGNIFFLASWPNDLISLYNGNCLSTLDNVVNIGTQTFVHFQKIPAIYSTDNDWKNLLELLIINCKR